MALFFNNIFLTLSFLSMKIEIPLIDIFGNYNGKILGTIFSFDTGISNKMNRNIDIDENTMWIVLINSAGYQPEEVLNKYFVTNISAIIITDIRNQVDVVMEYRRFKSDIQVFFMEYPYFKLITDFLQRNFNLKKSQSLAGNRKINDHTILRRVPSTTSVHNRREIIEDASKIHYKTQQNISKPNDLKKTPKIYTERLKHDSFIDVLKPDEKLFCKEKNESEDTYITSQEDDYFDLSKKNNNYNKFNNLNFTKNQGIDILKNIGKNIFIERKNEAFRNTHEIATTNTLIKANNSDLQKNKANFDKSNTRKPCFPEIFFETAIENKHDFNPTPFFVQLFLQIPPVLTILILILLWRTFSIPEDQNMDNQYIETLPLITYKDENIKNITFSDNTICCICLESYMQGDQIRCLYCHHIFHKICVDPWLCRTCICPICRKSIFLSENDPFFF